MNEHTKRKYKPWVCFLALLLVVGAFVPVLPFGAGSTVYAAAQTEHFTNNHDVDLGPGFDASRQGAYQIEGASASDMTAVAYCMDYSMEGPVGATYHLSSTKPDQVVSYLTAYGYPNRTFDGDAAHSRVITQIALWSYYDSAAEAHYTSGEFPAATIKRAMDFLAEAEQYAADVKAGKKPAFTCGYIYTTTDTTADGGKRQRILLTEPGQGELTVVKKYEQVPVNASNPNYSLSGAEYTVYANSGLTESVGKLTTNSAGKTGSLNLSPGTYYVKETKPSKGCALDPKTYTVKVSTGETTSVSSVETLKKGEGKIIKESAHTSITDGNNSYSLKGAVFGVYKTEAEAQRATKDDPGAPVVKLITKGDGTSNEATLFAWDYYVKELEAPEGYALDTSVSKLTVSVDKVTTLKKQDMPQSAIVELLLQKNDGERKKAKAQGDAALKGAVYKFSYYDGQYNAAEKAEASGEPTATWYFVTDKDGKISGNSPTLSSDYASSKLYKDKDGSICFPVGTYVIQEQSASEGYLVNDEKITAHVTWDGTDRVHVKTYNEKTKGEETVIHGGVKLSKIDNDLSEAYSQGDASLKGAEFTIFNRSKESVLVNGKEIPTGEACLKIKTDEEGNAESGCVLPYGSYSIKETTPSKGYLLNTEWEKDFSIRTEGEVKDLTGDKVREEVMRSGVQIVKRDKELEKSEAQGGATLEGIVMTIKNVSAHDVVVRSDFGSDETVNWGRLESKEVLFSDGKIKRVKPGEDVGKITVHWNDEKQAYTAETLSDDLPYGTYTIRESKTNDTYQRTDKTEHRFEVREDGTVYAYDNGLSEILTFDDYVYRSDVQGTKIGDSTSERFSYVPFKIISVTNGETHVVVTDKNGFFSTKDRRPAGALDEDEDADTARKQNPFDDLLKEKTITNDMLTGRSSDIQMGVWFGTGEAGSSATMNSDYGALPYDTYILEEMPCEKNEGYTLQKFSFTVDDKTQTGQIDLETITDDAPEIETMAAVDGENVDVTPKKEITLIDTIEYKGLKRGETYNAKGKLVDKSTGETMLDAKGNEITAETEFTAKRTDGTIKVTFVFDGSNMYGKETVVFESFYDADGRIAARHEDAGDEDQTVAWEKLDPKYEMYKIRTTKAPSKGNKYGFFAQDEVEYEVHVENTGNIEITTDVTDEFTESPGYFTTPELKDVTFSARGAWNNKGQDSNKANITLAPGESAVVTYTAKIKDEAKEYLAAAAKDSDSLDAEGHDTNKAYQKNETDDKDGFVNTAYCENTTYPNPENPDEGVPLEPKEDVAQTPVQNPEIGTTLTDQAGRKEVVASEKTVLVDTVSYNGLDKSKWYIITGTLIVKDTAQPLVENGEEITVTSKPFKPWKANGKAEIEFEINTKGLEGKELVAYETAYRLDDYKKGDDIRGAKKTEVASHRDINDKGQTVKIVKPDKPGNPVQPEKPYHAPKTGDPARTAIPVIALLVAFFVLLFAAAKKMKM